MSRRIVCWLTPDPCSLVAAKLAIRENESHGLPLVVVCDHEIHFDPIEALTYLGVPVVILSGPDRGWYRQPGDVHVMPVPIDEPMRYDTLTVEWHGSELLMVLADRALRRADCMELLRRANVNQTVIFRARPAFAELRAVA